MSLKAGRDAPSPGFFLVIVAAVLLVSGVGCLWGRSAKGPPPLPPGEQEEFYTRIEEPEPAIEAEAAEPPGQGTGTASPGERGEPGAAEDETAGLPAGVDSADPGPLHGSAGTVPPPAGAPPEPFSGNAASGEAVRERTPEEIGVPSVLVPAPATPRRVPPADRKVVAQVPPEVPVWALGKEVLVYRVEFLGMTMGYARFTFKGKVSLHGREAYHLNVRAWTSNFLSVIYPINDTIDYYLDVKTLAPLRQEFAHPAKEKDDVMIYDQENGKIVYRYKATGEIRKRVDATPNVYDPVSAAYYFRSRDLGAEERPRNVYGGRKLYQISTRLLGQEKIDLSGKRVDTVVVQPVIKRDGQPDDKGDLRMWMTTDARHVPVRFYAKFRKIREWTLYAELLPPREGG